MDNNEYTIRALPEGGFYVYPDRDVDADFASTTLDEALRYVRSKLISEPELAAYEDVFIPDPQVAENIQLFDTMYGPDTNTFPAPAFQSAWRNMQQGSGK